MHDGDAQRVDALLHLSRFPAAREILGRALAADPDDAQAWLRLAECHLGADEPAQGLEAAGRLVALAPAHAVGHILRSYALIELGQPTEAVEAARQALALQPTLWSAHRYLAHALALAGDIPGATGAIARATELAPEEPTVHHLAGWIASRSGDLAAAERAYLRALELDPQHADALSSLGFLRDDPDAHVAAMNADPTSAARARKGIEIVGLWLLVSILQRGAVAWLVLCGIAIVDAATSPWAVTVVRAAAGVAAAAWVFRPAVTKVRRASPAVRRYLRGYLLGGFPVVLLSAAAVASVAATLSSAWVPESVVALPLAVAGGLVLVAIAVWQRVANRFLDPPPARPAKATGA